MSLQDLQDAIEAVVKAQMVTVHTCLPGTIERYDHRTQSADVKPSLKRTFPDGTVLSVPVIVNVPVIWMRGGEALFTFPLNKGDGVLLLFAERNIDTWLSKGGEVESPDARRFDLSDCIAIPGLVDFENGTFPDNNDDVTLKYKTASIAIKPDGQVNVNNGNLTVDE